MTESKKNELKKATKALETLFKTLSNKPETISVSSIEDREIILVTINNSNYRIDVECENERQMVKSVVETVILKL